MSNESTEERLGFIARWKKYAEISNLFPIFRRYFVMNAFDGVLTALGLVLGTFVLYLADPQSVSQEAIVIPGLATTLAIGISGIIGAYLAETAERRKSSIELMKDMVETTPDSEECVHLDENDYYPKVELDMETANVINGEFIEHVDVDPVPKKKEKNNNPQKEQKKEKCHDKEEEEKSLSEQAESFASIVLSLTDGLSPAIGSLTGLIPFFFAAPNMGTYIASFILEVIILFSLGAYLAKISEDSIVKYGIEMVLAGVFTAAVSFLIGGGH